MHLSGPVYQLRADHAHHRWLGTAQSTMKPIGLLLRGKPLKAVWDPPLLEDLLDDELPDGPVADCAHFDGGPTFSRAAVDHLRDLLEPNGELLPVRYPGGEYFVYNVMTVVDALDESRSDILWSDDGQRILNIRRHELRADRIGEATIFRLPRSGNPVPYVTPPFVERVQGSGLTGFMFELVWQGP